MTPVRPSKFVDFATADSRIAYEIAGEDILGRIHPHDPRPEQPGADLLTLKSQSAYRSLRDGQVQALRITCGHGRHLRTGVDQKGDSLPLARVGLDLQFQLGAYDLVTCGLEPLVKQRNLDPGHSHDSDPDVPTRLEWMVLQVFVDLFRPTARTSTP